MKARRAGSVACGFAIRCIFVGCLTVSLLASGTCLKLYALIYFDIVVCDVALDSTLVLTAGDGTATGERLLEFLSTLIRSNGFSEFGSLTVRNFSTLFCIFASLLMLAPN